MLTLRSLAIVLSLSALVPGLMTGCASREISSQASSSLEPLRAQADRIEMHINRTGAAASDLLENPASDLTAQIDRLDQQTQSLQQTLNVGRQQAQSADASVTEYFNDWDQQLSTLSEDLAKSGQARRNQATASFDKLRGDMRTFGEQARAYVAEMDESVRYLRTDKTSAGVKTVTGKIRQALNRQPALLSQLDNIQSQIDAIRGVR